MKDQNLDVNLYRPLSTYSATYLATKETTYRWRGVPKNRKKYLDYQRKYGAQKRKNMTPADLAFFAEAAKWKYHFQKFLATGVATKRQNDVCVAMTGATCVQLLKHLGEENCRLWISGLRVVELDHILPVSRFKKNGPIRSAYHWSNLRIIPKQNNRNWKDCIDQKVSGEVAHEIVSGIVTQELGLN